MRTSLLHRISMALIFAFAALNVYAGINSGDEPYEFEEGLSDGGTYYYRTKDLEFKASNTEEIVLGGLQLLYKKGIYPVISIRIAGFEQSLIDLGKKTRRYEDKAMINQTLTLTLTNGEVISTYEAGVSDVLKKEFEDAEMANLGIQASVSDLSSSRSDFSSMSSSNRISHVIQQLTTFNIKKIVISGITLDVSTKSAPTYLAMFKALDKRFGLNYLKAPSYNTYTNLSATVKSITTEHNLYQNEQKGMNVKVSFDVSGMKGKTGICVAYFYFENGTALNDYNKHYYTTDGKVSSSTKYTPGWDNTTYTDLKIFLPYSELHLGSGKSHLKAKVEIFDNNNRSIGSSQWTYFNYTYP